MTLVERHKEIYKVLDIMNNPGIHGMKIKASSPEEMEKMNQKFGDAYGKFLVVFGIWAFIAFIFGIGY